MNRVAHVEGRENRGARSTAAPATWDGRDAAALSPSITRRTAWWRAPSAGGPCQGRDAIERLYATYFRAFTDIKLEKKGSADRRRPRGAFSPRRAAPIGVGSWGWPPPAARSGSPRSCSCMALRRQAHRFKERRIYDFTGPPGAGRDAQGQAPTSGTHARSPAGRHRRTRRSGWCRCGQLQFIIGRRTTAGCRC